MAKEGSRDRRHAARSASCGFGAFERTHPFLEHVHGGIGIAAIDEAFFVALEPRLGLLGGCIDVARVEEDRFRGLAELAPERTLVHEPGCLTPSLRRLVLVFPCRHGHPPLRLTGAQKTRNFGSSPKDRDFSHGPFSDLFNVAASRPAKSPRAAD